MGKLEKIVSDKPPAPTANAVIAHRKKLEAVRDALRTGAAELALKSAHGDTAAQAALWAIPAKQAGLQFEIDQNHAAHDQAMVHDHDAEAAWRKSLQLMDPDDLIAGIGRDCCPALCQPNAAGGCVITAGYPYAGAQCGHPIRELHAVFGRGPTGERKFLYAHNPRAARVFEAARLKLKVPTR
jgi:hypothetical protein